MARDLSDRVQDPAFWGEQLFHLFLAAVPCFLVYKYPPVLGFTLAAVWITLVREVVDGWPIESVGDMLVDSAFTIGGAFALGLYLQVR